MRASWVAGSTRARLLVGNTIGRERALEVGRASSLAAAIAGLAGTLYGERLTADASLAAAQRHVAATLLWHIRILAGWLPPAGSARTRALAGWFEIANVDAVLAELEGAESRPPFDLGTLACAASGIAGARSGADLRAALARSEWGDPGGDGPAEIVRGMRLAWARRLLAVVPEAGTWALGGVALLLARDVAGGHAPAGLEAARLHELRLPLAGAANVAELARLLPAGANWVLADTEDDDLWRAEGRFWTRVESDARRLVQAAAGPATVTGAVALLAVDARRVSAALAAASYGGGQRVLEVLDAVA